MEISVSNNPINGKQAVNVQYFEDVDGFGFSGEITVFVPAVDSLSELHASAREQAKLFLERALLAHSVEDQ